MIKYKETKLGITKDGHTMFRFDIVHDLNRKSYLEDLTVDQQQEIALLKSLAAYAEQRANIAEKTSEALKAKLQSAKADAVNDMVETIREVGPPNQLEASIRTHNSICNAIEGCVKVMREGKS